LNSIPWLRLPVKEAQQSLFVPGTFRVTNAIHLLLGILANRILSSFPKSTSHSVRSRFLLTSRITIRHTAAMSSHGASGGGGNASSSSQTGHDSSPAPATDYDPEALNTSLNIYLLVTLGALAFLLIFWRCLVELTKYVRTVTSLSNETQKFYARESGKMSWFKKNVLYAPIFRKRHNREFQISSAINVGTLPSRLQLVILIAYFALNIVFSVIDIPFGASFSTAAKIFRNRTGTLATVNLIPLFLLAGRNNPLIRALNISFDTMNLMHRWLGRIVVLESLAHTLAYILSSAQTKGVGGAFSSIINSPYLLYGLIVSDSCRASYTFHLLIARPVYDRTAGH
jgi:hypothetical protein